MRLLVLLGFTSIVTAGPSDLFLSYSVHFGGRGDLTIRDREGARGVAVAVDSQGFAYIAGVAKSPAASPRPFVAKLSADGSRFVYQTYLADAGTVSGVAVDRQGNAFAAGTLAGLTLAYVVKIEPSGSVVSARRLGPGFATAIAADPAGYVYVAGIAEDGFPTTPGAFQTNSGRGFAVKLTAERLDTVYSTRLGGGDDGPTGIAADRGSAYVCGTAHSKDFPLAVPATVRGASDGFILKIAPAGGQAQYSVLLGGSGEDSISAIAITSSGHAVVTGSTSSADFPIVGAANTEIPGSAGVTGFVSELDATGTKILRSTLIGKVSPAALTLDGADDRFVTGMMMGFPERSYLPQRHDSARCHDLVWTRPPFALPYSQLVETSCTQDFILRLNSRDETIYLESVARGGLASGSGIAVDPSGNVYVTGAGHAPVLDERGLGGDGFAVKLSTMKDAPRIAAGGVVNVASNAPRLSAGAIGRVTVQGPWSPPGTFEGKGLPLPFELGGVRVLVDGVLAPLFSVTAKEMSKVVTFQVPNKILGPATTLAVLENGIAAWIDGVFALGPMPGIFLRPDGSASMQHSDGTPVTAESPAAEGEVVTLYATGMETLGEGTSLDPGGLLRAPFVLIGGKEAEILFAGRAPGLVGIQQLNVRVPDHIGPSNVTVQVGQDVLPPGSDSNIAMLPVRGSGPESNPEVLRLRRFNGLALTIRDTRGAAEVSKVQLLINSELEPSRACFVALDADTGVVYLVDDAGTGLLFSTRASPRLRNSQCEVFLQEPRFRLDGTDLTLPLRLSFTAGFAGAKQIFAAAQSKNGDNSGWRRMGTLVVP